MAGEQEYDWAQYNLGWMYLYGEGVPQDYGEAVKWYRLAAEQGDDEAQYELGNMYYNGVGIPQNYIVAHAWVNLASANGYSDAQELRDNIASYLTPASGGKIHP
ncbi:MAG: tetratricopeptide repeat protein [Paracoccaceae bacterium]|nr:tetratricopeptide repeat protein [Paracoccaceae bacterium]MDE2916837.1 tetratricopeptide repeat protein [Paracoccaceae bacterium]